MVKLNLAVKHKYEGGNIMITLQHIYEARERIKNITHVTPILQSEQLSNRCGNQLFLKAEHVQKTGSFKIRGASNKVTHAVENRAQYITTASSGNHGQAVAYVANTYNIPATMDVSGYVTASKLHAIQDYNGKIEYCGTTSEERLPRAREIAEKENGIYIPPYDDLFIMAGQGTVGLELVEQVEHIDAVLVPVGGGGLM